MKTQIRYTAGGTLTHDLHEGRPTGTPTAALVGSDGTALGAATVTVDSVDTTTTAEAADGATALAVTDATGITAGRSYLLTGGGRSRWVTVQRVSGLAVTLADALPGLFPSGSTFESTRLSIAVPAAGAATLATNFSAMLTYVVDGTTYTDSVYYDVVRQPWPDVILTPAEYRRIAGPLAAPELERGGSIDYRYEQEIDQATEQVRVDILARGLRPDLFRAHEGFKRSIAFRVLLERAYIGESIPRAWQDQAEIYLETASERYNSELSRALSTVDVYDENEDAAISTAEETQRWGTIRMTR